MDTERNLLFGLLAQQAGLIDGPTLMLALRTWGANRDRPLAYILAEGGSLGPPQREQVEGDLERLLGDHAGNAAAALAAVLGGLQQQFAGATTGDLHDAIHGFLGAATHQTVISIDSADAHSTVDGLSRGGEPYLLKDPLPSGLRYTRTALHASGGMGQVWLAHDANIGRDVALKELRAESSARVARLPTLRDLLDLPDASHIEQMVAKAAAREFGDGRRRSQQQRKRHQ